jgi:FtsP/CotA-like multicopper oxidase with cupredoxin domain
MELRTTKPGTPATIPEKLVPLTPIRPSAAQVTRAFAMDDEGEMTINGKTYEMHRVDFNVKPGATEVWTVTNTADDFAHTFHVHGVQMLVLDRFRDGALQQLPPLDTGWKDTVLVYPKERVRLIGRFDNLEGIYMFHCHVLEHENRGMMGMFSVGRPGQGRAPHTAPLAR